MAKWKALQKAEAQKQITKHNSKSENTLANHKLQCNGKTEKPKMWQNTTANKKTIQNASSNLKHKRELQNATTNHITTTNHKKAQQQTN